MRKTVHKLLMIIFIVVSLLLGWGSVINLLDMRAGVWCYQQQAHYIGTVHF